MLARVVAVGAVRGVEELTYLVPSGLEQRVQPGHRVLAPLRSRTVTGVVLEVGDDLPANVGGELKEITEILEPRPLFDRAHLEMMRFLAEYYMVSLGEVYRSVIPALARVESRVLYELARRPDALGEAVLTEAERRITGALSRRAMTARQLRRLGAEREFAAALSRLSADGIVASRAATRGRHRETPGAVLRLAPGAAPGRLRGAKQREIVRLVAEAGDSGMSQDEIETRIRGARPALRALERRGVFSREPAAPIAAASDNFPAPVYSLTPEQEAAIAAVAPHVESRNFEAFLLWGVTGSGKTEIYLSLAALSLKAGRQVIVLVPEIALADELVRSFRARFGGLVGVAHSSQSVSERWASWQAALSGRARIMIGPRSLIFAPIHDAGLIVVDEEHDPAYKNEEGIRYNARDLAVVLARFASCPVVLGSATPSAESFGNCRRGRFRMLRLPRRVNDRPLAGVEIVDLRVELARMRTDRPAREQGPGPGPVPLSKVLIASLRENLAAGGQSMVFLNRRGYHNFLQCHRCGSVIVCPNCSVSMTFHLLDRSLRCHYCGNHDRAPDQCPECGGLELHGQGFGTERLEAALRELLPGARIERMDSDTSARRGVRAGILAALRAGEIDLLVGTQMITKGFDFPGVTLAAVILADLALNLPDFRSAERTFQLLTQVAGRAGRGERPGKVIIQTWAPHHYSIRAAQDQDYARFIRRELELRRELCYPPFTRLAMVRIEGEAPRAVSSMAEAVAESVATTSSEELRVLGPAPAPIERLRQRYRWQVMVKAQSVTAMRKALWTMKSALAARAQREHVYLGIDIDPVRML